MTDPKRPYRGGQKQEPERLTRWQSRESTVARRKKLLRDEHGWYHPDRPGQYFAEITQLDEYGEPIKEDSPKRRRRRRGAKGNRLRHWLEHHHQKMLPLTPHAIWVAWSADPGRYGGKGRDGQPRASRSYALEVINIWKANQNPSL
jgi:hypothetical protein